MSDLASPTSEEPQRQSQASGPQAEKKELHELLSHSIVDIYVGPLGISFPIHEKLLCHHSRVLRKHFYAKDSNNQSYGLPEDAPETFAAVVGWLYSGAMATPSTEKDIGPLLDAYLLADRLEMDGLSDAVVDTVRNFYSSTGTYPSLRRVQYVYDATDEDNALREMMVGSVARYLTLSEAIPKHWESALRRNGQLAVDIIRSIQEWHLESRSVPDVRSGDAASASGNGKAAMGFSSVVDGPASTTESAADVLPADSEDGVNHGAVNGA